MRKYGIVHTEEKILIELTCSVCGLDLMGYEFEREEAFHFSQVGGYTSIFGDGTEVYIDLCQHCFKKLLGQYCTVI